VAGSSPPWVAGCRAFLLAGCKRDGWPVWCVFCTVCIVAETITHNGVTYGTVTSPYTGRVWLDRNLGASRVCTAYNDSACYGDYYQWGRGSDGHEKENSSTVSTVITDINNTGSNFFIDPDRNYLSIDYDWLYGIDEDGELRANNWLKIDGTSVCPIGYKVATQNDLSDELIGVSSIQGAFNNFLKIPSSGARQSISSTAGHYFFRGTHVYLWTASRSDPNYAISRSIHLDIPASYLWFPNARSYGFPLRCVKDNSIPTANAGPNQTIAISTPVILDASSSTDNDGSIVSYTWKEYSSLLSTDAIFSKSDFSKGVHYLTLTVTDDKGATSTDTVTIYVQDIDTWEVTAKDNYEVDQGEFFSKQFDIDINNVFPDYTEEEHANVTLEDIQKEYDPKNLTVSLNNSHLDLSCELHNTGYWIGATCKISGTLGTAQTATLLVEDTNHSFSKSINIDFTISEYKIENVVTSNTYIVLNGDDITHHLSFGFDAVHVDGFPVCTFQDKNGNDSPMFVKKLPELENRYICATSDYGWDGQYYGSVDFYKLRAVAEEGNVEVKISFGDKTHTINVPVYERNELTANAVLEYAHEYRDLLFGFDSAASQAYVVINDRIYTMDSLPDKIYLGGTAVKGTNNKDFVYIHGGIWKLSFQGHEMLIKMEEGTLKSNLAFTVDGSDLSENSKIVEFITDPSSTYNMILKKYSTPKVKTTISKI